VVFSLTEILYAFLISPMRVTCSAHLILLDLITHIIFFKAQKLWRSSLCSLLQPPATFSLLGLNIHLSTSLLLFIYELRLQCLPIWCMKN
jgi:hypothetical protein